MIGFHVLVIGGGPAGAAAAIELSRLQRTVCLVENRPAGAFKVGESLPPALRPLLRDLGALPACEDGCAIVSYGNRSAWGSAIVQDTDFIRDPNGPGWHVDRARFDASLRATAAAAGACVLEQTRVRHVRRSSDAEGGWDAVLSTAQGEQACHARWIVDCTGRAAWFAQRHGVHRMAYDRLVAVAGTFAPANQSAVTDVDSRTLVESVADGWWYSSLVPGGRRVVAFHTDAVKDAVRLRRSPDSLHERLLGTRHVGPELVHHGYRLVGGLHVASANSARLSQFSGPGWLAAGDAALSFDPLSSQGILTALYGGIEAARAIHEDAIHRYQQRLEAVFAAYLRNRHGYYAQEQRWPDQPFWQARRQM